MDRILTTRVGKKVLALVAAALMLTATGCDASMSAASIEDTTYEMWRALAHPGADAAEHYRSLGALVDSATAVVRGVVVDAGPGRRFQGDADIDRFQIGQLAFRVDEILAGELPRRLEDGTILLETLRTLSGSGPVADGESILMLRWTPEVGPGDPAERLAQHPELEFRYTLAGDQSVWVPTSDGVRAPLLDVTAPKAEDGSPQDPVLADVGRVSFSDLANRIRGRERRN